MPIGPLSIGMIIPVMAVLFLLRLFGQSVERILFLGAEFFLGIVPPIKLRSRGARHMPGNGFCSKTRGGISKWSLKR